jgi:hypothetical protein
MKFSNGYMRLIMLIGLALLTGCAPLVLHKAGAGPDDLARAQYECQVQEQQSANAANYSRDPMSNMAYPWMARQAMRECLHYKGWDEQVETTN